MKFKIDFLKTDYFKDVFFLRRQDFFVLSIITQLCVIIESTKESCLLRRGSFYSYSCSFQ